MKTSNLVKEWLNDVMKDNNDYTQCYNKYYGNKPFYKSLVYCLKNNEEVDSICLQIYNFALIKNVKMNILLFDFLPNILKFYMIESVAKGLNTDNVLILRSCLISVRNLLYTEFYAEEDNSIFKIPVFADGSIYHSPIIRPDMDMMHSKTMIRLKKYEKQFDFVSDLIRLYNTNFNQYSSVSLRDFCDLSLRIVSLNDLPRITVSNRLLSELTVVLNSLLFKEEHSEVALETLSAIENRSNYEFMASVILSISAIRYAFCHRCESCLPFNSPLVAMNTMTHNRANSVNDTLITNATFRPEKVPEDIKAIGQISLNNNSTDIELDNIGFTNPSSKATNNLVTKSKIKFNLIENFVSKDADSQF